MLHQNIVKYLVVILIIMTIVWTIQIVYGYVPYVDRWTRELVTRFDNTFVYSAFFFITNLGSRHFLIPFVIVSAIVLGVVHKHWLAPVIFVGGTLITYELNGVIKDIIQRERPSILEEANAVGLSFPSGHAMISIVCYGLLAYFLAIKVKTKSISVIIQVLFSFIIFLIGISRYVINVHYLTDILAGFVIGFICLIGFLYLYRKLLKQTSRKRVGERSEI